MRSATSELIRLTLKPPRLKSRPKEKAGDAPSLRSKLSTFTLLSAALGASARFALSVLKNGSELIRGILNDLSSFSYGRLSDDLGCKRLSNLRAKNCAGGSLQHSQLRGMLAFFSLTGREAGFC